MSNSLSSSDLLSLELAAKTLENPGFAHKLTSTIGNTAEKAIGILPKQVSNSLTDLTRTALEKSLESALFTLNPHKMRKPLAKTHQMLAGLCGATGGVFGLAALAIELPISTTIMLRSIAEIAQNHGEDISNPGTKMACLEVFALTGNDTQLKSSDTGYYTIRSLLAKSLSDAATFISTQSAGKQSAPILVKAINIVAARFSIPVSEKIAAQGIPVLGAVGGASVNILFIRYFQEIAKAHFLIRKLERQYPPALVKKTYESISQQIRKKSAPITN